MSLLVTIILSLAIISLILFTCYYNFKAKNWKKGSFIALFIILFICLLYWKFNFPFPAEKLVSKGEEKPEAPLLISLFVCITLGMFSQHLYRYFSILQEKRSGFDIGFFIAPLFLSPIVVLPLFAALENANIDIYHFNQQTCMIFLIAFENGFFWKAFINQHEKKIIK